MEWWVMFVFYLNMLNFMLNKENIYRKFTDALSRSWVITDEEQRQRAFEFVFHVCYLLLNQR